MIWLIVLILLAVILFGGGWGYRPTYGYWSFSPLLLVLLLLIILILAHVIVL